MNTLLRLSPVGSSGGKWRVDSDPPKTVGALTRAQIDLWSVANGLFGCETLVRTNKKVEGIEIPLYQKYDSRLQSTLEAMLRFIVEQPIEVAFTQNSKSIQSTLIPETVEPFSEGYACLFSTGLDSYSVFLNAAIEFKDLTACFVDHSDFHKLRALFKGSVLCYGELSSWQEEPHSRRNRRYDVSAKVYSPRPDYRHHTSETAANDRIGYEGNPR
jgi:hypothetical protein